MRAKLGLGPEAAADELVADLLDLLRDQRVDFTSFFRALSGVAARAARAGTGAVPRALLLRRVGRALVGIAGLAG